MSSQCLCHTDEWCFYCEMYSPLKRECDNWKQRALAAEAQLGINLPFATDNITAKQRKVFECIESYFRQHNVSPTLREITDMAGYASVSTVHGHLDKLEQKGYVKRLGKRGLQLLVRSEV